jgi:integrase
MRWADIDLHSGWWTIPGTDTKNGEPHRVPLVAAAIEIIKAQEPDEKRRGVYVFTGNGEATVVHRAKKAPAARAPQRSTTDTAAITKTPRARDVATPIEGHT